MLHHLTLWVPDIDRARTSWTWLLRELGYSLTRETERALVFRDGSGLAIVVEQSEDMVPGMLHSRFRPGMNHVAFRLPPGSSLTDLVAAAAGYGWSHLDFAGHPIADGSDVAYLEDRDGFEVELVAAVDGLDAVHGAQG